MSLDVHQLLTSMVGAARDALAADWPEARDFSETEFRKFVETLEMIARLTADGSITPERARMHIEFQKRSMQAVLLTVRGLGVLAVENAVNAAIGAVRDMVNTALGFRLL